MRPALLLLVLTAPAVAQGKLAAATRILDKKAAARLAEVGARALSLEQGATARRIFTRVIELDGDNAAAHRALGYRKRGGRWERALEDERMANMWLDRDARHVADVRRRVRREELRRARAVVTACEKYGTAETSRPFLLALLDRTPRLAAAHQALGHERIGANHVRPEFARMVKELRREVRAWSACRTTDLAAKPTGERLRLQGAWPVYRVGHRRVAGTYAEGEARQAAEWTEAPHQLVRYLFGEYAEAWEPQTVYFLTPDRYAALVRQHTKSAAEAAARLRWRTYYHARFVASRADDALDAADGYAHSVGFMTMDRWASPDAKGATGPRNEYSWLNEGFGYFMSLELFNRAETYFATDEESSAKIEDLYPPPLKKTKATCLAYVREQMLHGTAYPLREIFGRSLNNLDRLASLEAWTFVRFLFLHDAEGMRTLVGELQRQTKGPLPERADRALQAAFDKSIAQLEPVWRRFTLEID